jgi:hypothetical protein
MPVSDLLFISSVGPQKAGEAGGYAAHPAASARGFGVFARMKRGPGNPGPLSAS